jgi:hypothetical protein
MQFGHEGFRSGLARQTTSPMPVVSRGMDDPKYDDRVIPDDENTRQGNRRVNTRRTSGRRRKRGKISGVSAARRTAMSTSPSSSNPKPATVHHTITPPR